MTDTLPIFTLPAIFDRKKIQRNRNKACFKSVHQLFQWTSSRLIERLSLVKKEFSHVLEIGSSLDFFYQHLSSQNPSLESYYQMDSAQNLLMASHRNILSIRADEESLPLEKQNLDLIVSHLTAHFMNDLPGFFKQVNHALKPDGYFLGVMFGEQTLQELSIAFYQTHMDLFCGASPVVAPFITPHQAGNLLMRAGFQLPVVDRETVEIHYDSLGALLKDIKAFGGQAALYASDKKITNNTLKHVEKIYRETFSTLEGKLIVTLDFLFLSGFAYHPSQPKALRPHYTEKRLIDVLSDFSHAKN